VNVRGAVLLSSLAGLLVCTVAAVSAAEVQLTPLRDNTIYAPNSENRSNGGGARFGAGKNGFDEARRGLLLFDLAAVPPRAEIVSATLTLTLAQAGTGDPDRQISLHRALASWGENQASDAGTGTGSGFGVPAEPGDATWLERFFGQGPLWTTPGGDFVALASATTAVPALVNGISSWSGAGVLADARAWHAAPAGNFGWIVIGDETIERTNRQFHSRETTQPGAAPLLQVTYYDQAPGGIAREPGGGFRLHFAGVPGRTYTVQFTGSLASPNWQTLGDGTADTEGRFSLVDTPPTGTTQRFYRALLP
jgi:hypothetical protein